MELEKLVSLVEMHTQLSCYWSQHGSIYYGILDISIDYIYHNQLRRYAKYMIGKLLGYWALINIEFSSWVGGIDKKLIVRFQFVIHMCRSWVLMC